MQGNSPCEELFLCLAGIRIRNTTFDRANRLACLVAVKSDTLGAQGRIDDEDFLTLTDRFVGTLRLTSSAIDAFIGNYGGQRNSPSPVNDNQR